MKNRLLKGINDAITTLTLREASDFPPTGVVKIEDEYIAYSFAGFNSISQCVRGYAGSTAVAHDPDTLIELADISDLSDKEVDVKSYLTVTDEELVITLTTPLIAPEQPQVLVIAHRDDSDGILTVNTITIEVGASAVFIWDGFTWSSISSGGGSDFNPLAVDSDIIPTTDADKFLGASGFQWVAWIQQMNSDGAMQFQTNANGDIIFSPNGTGLVLTDKTITPSSDGDADLGTEAVRFGSAYLSGALWLTNAIHFNSDSETILGYDNGLSAFTFNGGVLPNDDNSFNLGDVDHRWDEFFAVLANVDTITVNEDIEMRLEADSGRKLYLTEDHNFSLTYQTTDDFRMEFFSGHTGFQFKDATMNINTNDTTILRLNSDGMNIMAGSFLPSADDANTIGSESKNFAALWTHLIALTNGTAVDFISSSDGHIPARVSGAQSANETALWIYDADSAALNRVQVTANDAVIGVTGRVLYVADI